MACMRYCSLKRFFWISFLFIMEAIDLGLDWNFHAEINSTEQKIQHKTELRYAILGFAIFGSITFVLGLVSLFYEITKNCKHLVFCTVMSMISTWIEDFPQIVLAVIFAVWSSEVISNVQYAKAGYAIFEASVHIMISFWQLCCRGDSYAEKPTYLTSLIILDAFGGVVILTCSIFLFIELIEDKYH